MTQPGGYTLAPGPGWTDTAATWPVQVVSRETEAGHWLTDVVPAKPRPPYLQVHLCCTRCAELPSVFCLSPGQEMTGYVTTAADLQAGILGHIRRSHPDVVASS